MKQTLEEAAKQGAEGYNIVGQVIYKSGFKAGAKWEKEQAIEMFSWQDMKRSPREAFSALIDKVSGKGMFASNPYVFAYEFELID